MEKKKGVTLATVVPTDVAKFVDDKHWDLRKNKSEIVREAVIEWCKKAGYKPAE